jgi:hypothetical protein
LATAGATPFGAFAVAVRDVGFFNFGFGFDFGFDFDFDFGFFAETIQ